jgi:hypothetical protein
LSRGRVLSVSDQIFRSFLQAGFECSTHKYRDGRRLDLLKQTQHDRFALADYQRIRQLGIRTVRTGARWHLIEQQPGEYTFDSLLPTLHAAYATEIEVLLDLLHFGWPDDLDIFGPKFVDRFSRYVRALACYIKHHREICRVFAPVNEISFLSWVGGDVANIYPHAQNRGGELKRILVRATIVASDILLNELPDIRLISPEPVIHIVGDPQIPGDESAAENYRLAQFEAWDMLSGKAAPELGGRPEYLDIIGTNFYDRNEWVNFGETLTRSDPRYRPFHQILDEVWERYGRPIFVSETGTENDARADWFNYICNEVETARNIGIPVHGICLYPILNHPGWVDDRHCCNGLFDYADSSGHREIHQPLADAIYSLQERLRQSSHISTHELQRHRPDLFVPSSMGFRISKTPAPDEQVW